LVGLFNFQEEERAAWIDMGELQFMDLLSGKKCVLKSVKLPANGYAWYYQKRKMS